jgi:hypothetical protein
MIYGSLGEAAQRRGTTGMPRETVPIEAARRAWSRLLRRNVKVSSSPSTSPCQPSLIARCKDKKFISKGEFAHDVAVAVQDGQPFVVPGYLREAITAALAEPGESGATAGTD